MYYLCHLPVVNQDKSNAIDLVVASVVTSLELVITYVYTSFQCIGLIRMPMELLTSKYERQTRAKRQQRRFNRIKHYFDDSLIRSTKTKKRTCHFEKIWITSILWPQINAFFLICILDTIWVCHTSSKPDQLQNQCWNEKVRKKFSRPVRLYSIYVSFTVAYAAQDT